MVEQQYIRGSFETKDGQETKLATVKSEIGRMSCESASSGDDAYPPPSAHKTRIIIYEYEDIYAIYDDTTIPIALPYRTDPSSRPLTTSHNAYMNICIPYIVRMYVCVSISL